MTLNLLSQNYISELTANNFIRPIADQLNNNDHAFFEIVGFNPDQVRLAVSKSARVCSWKLVGYDQRDLWFALGDRPDLAAGFEFKSLSWRNDCGKALKYGYETPVGWVQDLLVKH